MDGKEVNATKEGEEKMSTSQLSRFTTMAPTSYDGLGLGMGLAYYVIGRARRGITQPWSSARVSPALCPSLGGLVFTQSPGGVQVGKNQFCTSIPQGLGFRSMI